MLTPGLALPPLGAPELILLWLLLLLLPQIFYIRTLQRALQRCSPESQTMRPALVWLILIPGFNLFWHFIVKRLDVRGFLVFDYADRYREAMEKLGGWLAEGKLKYRERITDGIENAPQAFLEMMQGANTGKQLVRLGDE